MQYRMGAGAPLSIAGGPADGGTSAVTLRKVINLDRLRRVLSDSDGDIVLIRRLFSENVRAYAGRYALGFLFMGLAAGTTAANAWLMRDVVNGIFLERQLSLAWVIGGAIIAGSQQPYGYYDPYYNAPPPGYYRPQGPAYYEPTPRGGPRQCWVESGPNGATGYWSPC